MTLGESRSYQRLVPSSTPCRQRTLPIGCVTREGEGKGGRWPGIAIQIRREKDCYHVLLWGKRGYGRCIHRGAQAPARPPRRHQAARPARSNSARQVDNALHTHRGRACLCYLFTPEPFRGVAVTGLRGWLRRRSTLRPNLEPGARGSDSSRLCAAVVRSGEPTSSTGATRQSC
jgi:hypothetical protein